MKKAIYPHDDYGTVTKLLMDQGIETVYDCTFHLYLPEKKAFHNRMKYDFSCRGNITAGL